MNTSACASARPSPMRRSPANGLAGGEIPCSTRTMAKSSLSRVDRSAITAAAFPGTTSPRFVNSSALARPRILPSPKSRSAA